MKQLCMAALAALLSVCSLQASAFVLQFLDGTTLENASIDNLSGSRVMVTGRLPDGSITTKTVSFADLTPASRDALMWRMRDRLLIDSKPGWFYAGPASANNDLPPASDTGGDLTVPSNLPIVLPGAPGYIMLMSVMELTNGTLGWASSYSFDSLDQTQSYGKIYVYGILLLQGANWIGNVYPTKRTIWWENSYYPCFATTPETAERINATVEQNN